MAAAAITIVGNPATLESDTTGAVITNGSTDQLPAFCGELRNHGPADVWVKVSQDTRSPATAAGVVTTGAQAQNQIPLAAGDSIPIKHDYKSIAHKTAAGTAVLSWVPH